MRTMGKLAGFGVLATALSCSPAIADESLPGCGRAVTARDSTERLQPPVRVHPDYGDLDQVRDGSSSREVEVQQDVRDIGRQVIAALIVAIIIAVYRVCRRRDPPGGS